MRVYKEFLSRYSEEEIKNNPESIVQEFIDWERKNNPKIKAVREPMIIRNYYHIRYNKFEDLKEAYNKSLREPFADEMAVRATYKKKFIDDGLKDLKAKRIYDNLKSGTKENILIREDIDIFGYYTDRLAVIELIKFEDFLNSREQPKNKSNRTDLKESFSLPAELNPIERKKHLNKLWDTFEEFLDGTDKKDFERIFSGREIPEDKKVNWKDSVNISDIKAFTNLITLNGGRKRNKYKRAEHCFLRNGESITAEQLQNANIKNTSQKFKKAIKDCKNLYL